MVSPPTIDIKQNYTMQKKVLQDFPQTFMCIFSVQNNQKKQPEKKRPSPKRAYRKLKIPLFSKEFGSFFRKASLWTEKNAAEGGICGSENSLRPRTFF